MAKPPLNEPETKRLTIAHDDQLAGNAAMTAPGMAHFAGTGPKGTVCGRCEFVTVEKRNPKSGHVEFVSCRKWRQLMRQETRKRFRPNQPSCKYWGEAPPEVKK